MAAVVWTWWRSLRRWSAADANAGRGLSAMLTSTSCPVEMRPGFAGMVREESLQGQLVAVLRALLLDGRESRADLEPLTALMPIIAAAMSESRRPYTGSPQPTGTPFATTWRAPQESPTPQLVHEGLSLGTVLDRARRTGSGRPRPRTECDLLGPSWREMPAHLRRRSARAAILGDRARSDAYRRLGAPTRARRRGSRAARILPVTCSPRVPAETCRPGRSIFRALILVSGSGSRSRCPSSSLRKNARRGSDAVGFLALRHVARGAGAFLRSSSF